LGKDQEIRISTCEAEFLRRHPLEEAAVNVSERVRRLRAMAASELRKLPDKLEEDNIVIDGRPHTVITWHDEIETGHHRIVVAAYRKAVGGIATTIYAEGFVVTLDDNKRNLTDVELAPFQ
jgi:hypothetical protein